MARDPTKPTRAAYELSDAEKRDLIEQIQQDAPLLKLYTEADRKRSRR